MLWTDADYQMAEMTDAANTAAAGVCIACEEALNPFHPKWASDMRRPGEPESIASAYGPESSEWPGYHVRCLEDMQENGY